MIKQISLIPRIYVIILLYAALYSDYNRTVYWFYHIELLPHFSQVPHEITYAKELLINTIAVKTRHRHGISNTRS